MKSRQSVFPFALAGMALVLVVAGGPSRAQIVAPTVQQCVTAWNDSLASDSCTVAVSVSGSRCRIEAACAYDVAVKRDPKTGLMIREVHHRDNDFYGSTTEVTDLKNCDGHLKDKHSC